MAFAYAILFLATLLYSSFSVDFVSLIVIP